MARSSRWSIWLILAGFIVLAGGILWLSPAEKTLGEHVRIVYLHVALTRAGEIGLLAAGLLGLGLIARPDARLGGWVTPASRVGLGFYVAGFCVSLVAQQVIWGGISIREPRMIAAMNVLAAAAIVQVLVTWIAQARIQYALHAALAVVVTWASLSAQNVLHPTAAIASSGSAAIKLHSYALLAVCLLAAAWIVWNVRQRQPVPVLAEG